MNTNKLDKTRLYPCFAEVYENSECVTDIPFPITWENMVEKCVYGIEFGQLRLEMPYEMFYLDHDSLKNIVDKWCKGLHYFWYYAKKLDFEDPEYKQNVQEMHDFRFFEQNVSEDKVLTPAQRAAKIKKEAQKHNFIRRSREREYIANTIYLGPSPTSNKETFDIAAKVWGVVKDILDELVDNNSITFKRWSKITPDEYNCKYKEAESFKGLCDEVIVKSKDSLQDTQHRNIDSLITQAIALYMLINPQVGM